MVEEEWFHGTLIGSYFHHLGFYPDFVHEVLKIHGCRGEAVYIHLSYGVKEDAVGHRGDIVVPLGVSVSIGVDPFVGSVGLEFGQSFHYRLALRKPCCGTFAFDQDAFDAVIVGRVDYRACDFVESLDVVVLALHHRHHVDRTRTVGNLA